MAAIYKYSILQAVPDVRRGERVNIGIAVFLPKKIDVRFSDTEKLKIITRESWASYLEDVQRRLIESYKKASTPEDAIAKFSVIEKSIQSTELGWFSLDEDGEYETKIKNVLDALVNRQRIKKKTQSTRINTEIAREFRRTKILATDEESIKDHKVVRDFYVSRDEDLKADFALKNGVYHIAATLDLRRAHVAVEQAAVKAIVLDKAAKNYKGAHRIGIYAVDDRAEEYKPYINLLKDYSTKTYNWLDPKQRRQFSCAIHEALDIKPNLLRTSERAIRTN